MSDTRATITAYPADLEELEYTRASRRQRHELDRRAFIRRYVNAMHEGQAALFVGAGLSRPAGFVDWRALLEECATELGLQVDREHDLVALAQYYLNRTKDRWRLNQILRDQFDRRASITDNHKLIARLPIQTIWTTNFDQLIEQALHAGLRNVDVKSREKDVPLAKKGRDVVLYKMHGDIARPDELIICKDDYEQYARKHPLFQNALQGDLVSKTFLFLGFSFADPNIDYMLGHLRSLLDDNKREHYAIMRRVRLDWHLDKREAQARYEYDRNRQDLRIEDLQRYNIQTILIDQYEELGDILEALERAYHRRSVFVSGSANQFGDFGEDRMRDFCMRLGEQLMKHDYRLITGMGFNIGDTVVKGALAYLVENGGSIEKSLFLRPFPRTLPKKIDDVEFNRKYRESLISKSGFAIFIAGTSRSNVESVGVMQEFELATALGRVPIPVGATGFAARRIWETVRADLTAYYGDSVPVELFDKLNDQSLSNYELVNTVLEFMEGTTTNS